MKLLFLCATLVNVQLLAMELQQPAKPGKKITIISHENILKEDDFEKCEECCLWIPKLLCTSTLAIIANNNLNRSAWMNGSVVSIDISKLTVTHQEAGLVIGTIAGLLAHQIAYSELRHRNKKRQKLREERHVQRLVEIIHDKKNQ